MFWAFVEEVTGHSHEWWLYKYCFETKECVVDHLYEDHGIVVSHRGEGHYYFWIPKTMQDKFDWILNNTTNPIKILKRKSCEYLTDYYFTKSAMKSRRDRSIEFSEGSILRKMLNEQRRKEKLENILYRSN